MIVGLRGGAPGMSSGDAGPLVSAGSGVRTGPEPLAALS